MSQADNPNRKVLRVLRIIIYIIPFLIFIWLFNKNFVPTGNWQVVYHNLKNDTPLIDFESSVPFVGFKDENNDTHWILNNDLTKFNIKLPRAFEKMQLDIAFKSLNQPYFYIESQSRRGLHNQVRLVSADYLDQLTWAKTQENNLILWQKEYSEKKVLNKDSKKIEKVREPIKRYQTIKELLMNPPVKDKFGVINFDTKSFYQLPNYQAQKDKIALDHPIRGPHQLLVYIKDEALTINLTKRHLNREPGKDTFEVVITFVDDIVYQKFYPDTSEQGNTQKIEINQDNLEEGIYKIEFVTNNDIIIEEMETTNQALVFVNRIFFSDGPAYFPGREFKEINLVTDDDQITFETSHQEGLQNIIVSEQEIEIEKTNKVFQFNQPKSENSAAKNKDMKSLKIEKGDLIVGTKNYIGFSENLFFHPEDIGRTINQTSPLDLDEFDYILAKYDPAKNLGELKKVSLNLNLKELFVNNNTYFFNFYAPGLQANNKQVKIEEIAIRAQKQPIWRNFKSRLSNFIKGLL